MMYDVFFVVPSASDAWCIFCCTLCRCYMCRVLSHIWYVVLSQPWIKNHSSYFDVTKGWYNGAEVRELIGINITLLISGYTKMTDWQFFKIQATHNLKKNIKNFQIIFESKGWDIIIKCNLKIVNCFDFTLNLDDVSHRPYKKPN